jgi:lipopolysaccharide export system protein LptA
MTSLFCLIYFFSVFIAPQDDGRLHIVHADKSIGKMIDGEAVRVLSGNVEAYQDTLHMYFDEGIYYENDERARFSGNVIINDGHHVIRADRINYYPERRFAHCTGNVRISSSADSLYAEVFYYYFREGNARGEQNVFLWDKENNVRVWGDYGRFKSENKSTFITGNARFEQNDNSENDTLIITANQFNYFGIDPKRAIAIDSVRIRKGEVMAECDSATYLVSEEIVKLRVKPLAWQGASEMKGQTIDLKLDSLKIKEIFLTEDAYVKSLADTLREKYNHLQAKSIQVSMKDRQPYRVIARRNARSIYLLEEEGTNSASSDSIIVFFKNGEMDSIAIIGGSEGTFYPLNYSGDIKNEF